MFRAEIAGGQPTSWPIAKSAVAFPSITRSIHKGNNSAGRVPLQPVVHEQERHPLLSRGARSARACDVARLGIRILHLRVGRERLHGLLVRRGRARSSARQTRKSAVTESGIAICCAQFRHLRPGVVHVRHAVAAQAARNSRAPEIRDCGSPRRSGIPAAARPETDPGGREIRPTRAKLRWPKAPNSKISSAVLSRCGQQRAQEHLLQHVRVQERFVLRARLRPVARVRGEDLAGDLLRHFEGEAEIPRAPARTACSQNSSVGNW